MQFGSGPPARSVSTGEWGGGGWDGGDGGEGVEKISDFGGTFGFPVSFGAFWMSHKPRGVNELMSTSAVRQGGGGGEASRPPHPATV